MAVPYTDGDDASKHVQVALSLVVPQPLLVALCGVVA